MFKNINELEDFMIFCHTHYELNDVWRMSENEKGILFEGPHNNDTGNQKYSPFNLKEEKIPLYKKRTKLSELYDVWEKVNNYGI